MENRLVTWLKQYLDTTGSSIRDLGGDSDMSYAYIAKILRGDKPVTWNFAATMAKATHEPIWKFFILAGLIDEVTPELTENEEIRVLVSEFTKLISDDKKDVLNYIKWLRLKSKN